MAHGHSLLVYSGAESSLIASLQYVTLQDVPLMQGVLLERSLKCASHADCMPATAACALRQITS
jgi:hypothetical protein